MAEIRGTIEEKRVDRIVHHLTAVHRELREEPGLDAWDTGELGKLVDETKDAIAKRTACRG